MKHDKKVRLGWFNDAIVINLQFLRSSNGSYNFFL